MELKIVLFSWVFLTLGTVFINHILLIIMTKDEICENDKITLKLIPASARTQEFQFPPSTSAAEVCQYVFDNWPSDWEEDRVAVASLLKLIYHGRFLHGSVTLNALSLPVGKVTVMHLVTRENLPEPNSSDSIKKAKRSSCCRCCIC